MFHHNVGVESNDRGRLGWQDTRREPSTLWTWTGGGVRGIKNPRPLLYDRIQKARNEPDEFRSVPPFAACLQVSQGQVLGNQPKAASSIHK